MIAAVTAMREEEKKRAIMGVTVCRNRSKYILIFLFLSLFGLILLLRNMEIVGNWNCHTISALQHLQSRIQTSILPLSLPTFHHNRTFCAHLGQKPSPEEELEERYLLNSIAWPGPPPSSKPVALYLTSDPVHSLFTILPTEEGRTWYVGGQLEVLVQMYDFHGRPKKHGGDFLLARLHSPQLGAAVAGEVVDNRNGRYSALFPLLWAGSAQVEITMVHSSEAVAVLQRLSEERPDRVYFQSQFQVGSLLETTVCNMCLPNQQPLCNFTDLHTGEPWYCYKPKKLSCDTRINHSKGGYLKQLITNKEALLFQSGVNLKVHIHASGPDWITVLPSQEEKVETENSSVKTDPDSRTTSGYYYEDVWRPLGGFKMRQFNQSSAIAECLRNKMVYMYGDSTVRQWFEYLITFVPELKEFNLQSPRNVGPFMAMDSTHNILVKYRCHGPPIRFSTVMSSELRYVSNELDGLTGGPNTVVVISIWSHFSTYPIDIYIRRLRHIRRAVLRLLDRMPGTLVAIRSANLQALDQEVSLYNSDWFSLQSYQVLRSMFKGMKVLFVDAWQMTSAHHLPHNLHPTRAIVKNMMDMFLSYVCQ